MQTKILKLNTVSQKMTLILHAITMTYMKEFW